MRQNVNELDNLLREFSERHNALCEARGQAILSETMRAERAFLETAELLVWRYSALGSTFPFPDTVQDNGKVRREG